MEPSTIARQAQKLNYQSPGVDFMQNCDLPPPLKVFTGLDKAVGLSMSRVRSMGRENHDEDDDQFHHVNRDEGADENKLELLKALRLSQTRAREAERKVADLAKEKERISNALIKDSLQLFGYRQLVRLLEIQGSKLQSQLLKQKKNSHPCDKQDEGIEGGNGDEISWLVALALCLGFATVGFAFSFR
ncbi:hypothetical protein PTKIN_Ptkin08bG0139400 [Pterospermum kingtungense]